VHRSTDFRTILTVSTDLTTINNFYIIVIDKLSNEVKRMSLYTAVGFIDGDMDMIDNHTLEVRIHRVETTDWEYGNYHFQLFASYDDADFEDSIRLDSNSKAVFRLVHENVPTNDDPYVSGIMPYVPIDVHNDLSGRTAADSHPIEAITGLQDELDDKAPILHSHTIGDVDNLQTELDGKSDVGHVHGISEITYLDTELAQLSAGISNNADDITDNTTAISLNTAERHSHSNKAVLDVVTDSGVGTQFLADDGTYKPASGGGASTFTELTDTPASYIGNEGKRVTVNESGDGLVFLDSYEVGEVEFRYRFSTDTSATAPADGYAKLNNSDYSLVTELYISSISWRDDQTEGALGSLNTGDVIVMRDANTSKFVSLNVVGKGTDNGDWYTLPVAYRNSEAPAFNNGERFDIGLLFIGAKYWTGLLDTPHDYTGNAAMVPRVKGDESGLEFSAAVGQDTTDTSLVANNIWVGSQAEYDALTPDATTLYFIV